MAVPDFDLNFVGHATLLKENFRDTNTLGVTDFNDTRFHKGTLKILDSGHTVITKDGIVKYDRTSNRCVPFGLLSWGNTNARRIEGLLKSRCQTLFGNVQKKSTQGIKTPKHEIDLVHERLKRLKELL